MRDTQDTRDYRARPRGTAAFAVFMLVALASVACFDCSPANAASLTGFAGPEGVSNVSVNGRDVLIADAYEMLGKASGVRVSDNRRVSFPRRKISFSIINEPYWVALQRINEKAGMRVGKRGIQLRFT